MNDRGDTGRAPGECRPSSSANPGIAAVGGGARLHQTRIKLPDRRRAFTFELEWRGSELTFSVGLDRDWRVREIFADGHKTGTDLEALYDDACIVMSEALQRGLDVAALAAKLRREAVDPQASAASFIACLAEGAARAELDLRRERGIDAGGEA